MTRDCSCHKCVGACRNQPGWFMPGEAEKAAALLGIPFEEFAAKHLIVDYHYAAPSASADNEPSGWSDVDQRGVRVYVPRKDYEVGGGPVREFAAAFKPGVCVFLKDGLCSIHAAKPYECRHAMACGPEVNLRPGIVAAWESAGNPLRVHPMPRVTLLDIVDVTMHQLKALMPAEASEAEETC